MVVDARGFLKASMLRPRGCDPFGHSADRFDEVDAGFQVCGGVLGGQTIM